MPIKVVPNITGTHVKNELLRVRLDLFIDEPLSKTYKEQHVYLPVIPKDATEEQINDPAWLESLPHIWQLNPAMCHFITVPETIKSNELEQYIQDIFDQDLVATLDDVLVLPDSAHRVSSLMRAKGKFGRRVETLDRIDLISSVNAMLNGLVIQIDDGGKSYHIEPKSIDVGAGATDRAATHSYGYTVIDLENPANASGVLDTVEVWANTNIGGFIFGTFYGSGSSYTCRDSESIGNVASGSKQTFTGKTINVQTGDVAGNYFTSGDIERDTDGAGGTRWVQAEYIDAGDSYASYQSQPTRADSIYATGTESLTEKSVGSGSLASSSILNRMTAISPGAGAVAIAGSVMSLFKQFLSVGSGVLITAGALGRMTAKAIGDGLLTIAGAINRLTAINTGSGVVSIASTLGRKISAAIGGALTASGNLGRMIARGIGDGDLSLSSALSEILVGGGLFFQNVGSGAVGIASDLGRVISRGVGSGALTITSILGRLIPRNVGNGSVGLTSSLSAWNGFLKIITLTLWKRSTALTLKLRTRALTLKARSRNLTLPERD